MNIVNVARCPEHGLHGKREECFDCGGPVEQVPMVEAAVYHEARARVVEYEDFIANDPRARSAFSAYRAVYAPTGDSPISEPPREATVTIRFCPCCGHQLSYPPILRVNDTLRLNHRITSFEIKVTDVE